MNLAVRAVFLVLLISTAAVAQKSKYWWLFPNFDENGLNSQQNSAKNTFKNDLRNGTEELIDVNFSVDAALNLDSNIDIDAENEENQNDNEGSGSSALHQNWVNKTNTAGTSKTIPGENNDEDLTVDKDLKVTQTDADATALDDASQEDNEAEIEREDHSDSFALEEVNLNQQLKELVEKELDKLDLDQELTKLAEEEELNEAAQVEGDAYPVSKLEEQRNDDEVAFSGENELEEKDLEFPENSHAFNKERDEVVHENGDAHPSSKVLLEKLDLNSDETEDSDLFTEEKDKPVHDHGDAHPSSRLELEETESNIDEMKEMENVEEESFTSSEVVPEDTEPVDKSSDDQDNSSSEESKEKIEDKTREEIIDETDFERLVEDDLIEDEERAAEKQQMELKENNKFGESVSDEVNQDEDDSPQKNREDLDDDVILHWVNEETLNTNSSIMNNDNSEIMPTAVNY